MSKSAFTICKKRKKWLIIKVDYNQGLRELQRTWRCRTKKINQRTRMKRMQASKTERRFRKQNKKTGRRWWEMLLSKLLDRDDH